MPIVSIILATYNREHLIYETLISIQNQQFQDWECLIIDDGGTDNTYNRIHPLVSTDKRFSYYRRPENYLKGLPGCRNYGISLSEGEYIIFYDDDDWIHPQNLLLTTTYLSNHPEYTFCQYTKQSFTDSIPNDIPVYNGLTIEQEQGPDNLSEIVTEKVGMASCTVLWRKSVFAELFRETLMYAEEWELYTRILAKGARGVIAKEILYYNRKHPSSNTGAFWQGNSSQIDSKMQAASEIIQTLSNHNLLTNVSRRYLINIIIRNRGYDYLKQCIPFCHFKLVQKWNTYLYYFCFPVVFSCYRMYHQFRS